MENNSHQVDAESCYVTIDSMWTPEKIAGLRKKLGLTLSEFGALVGVCMATVSYWESGQRHPKYETQLKLVALQEATATRMRRGRRASARDGACREG
jgi:DNA-binding transcriptional regulator YiaG